MPLDTKQCPSGCQSFCQMGKQSVFDNVDLLQGNDLLKWKTWLDFKKNQTIQTDNGLSAASQQSLIDYIKAAYSAGDINNQDGSLQQSIDEYQSKNISSNITIDSFTESLPSIVENNTVNSNDVIYAKHYNNFLYAITTQTYTPITKDLKNNNINQGVLDGPMAGKPASEIVPKVQSGQPGPYQDQPESQITATVYNELAQRAKNLLFHPHQCNECNIYEGGQFGEIVKELGTTIARENPTVMYDQGGFYNLGPSVMGVNGIHFRQDCSGFISACVAILVAVSKGTSYNTCDQVSGDFMSEGFALGNMGATEFFVPANQEHSCQESMIFASEGHVEASDSEGNIWSGGGPTGAPMMSTLGTKTVSSCPAYWKAVASGGSGAQTGAGSGFNTDSIGDVSAEDMAMRATCEIGSMDINSYRIYISAMCNRADYYLHCSQYKMWMTPGYYFASSSFGHWNASGAAREAALQAAADVKAGRRYCPSWVNTNDALYETTLSYFYSPSNPPSVGTRYTGTPGNGHVGTAYFYCFLGDEVIGGTSYSS